MPDYEYEALDSSGKLMTGTSSHPNEAFARAKRERLGLRPTKLFVKPGSVQETKQRTFLDAVIQGIVGSLFGYGKFGKSVLSLFGIAKFGGRGHYTSRSSYNDSHRGGGSCGGGCGGGGCGGGG